MIDFLCKLWPYLAGGLIGWLLAGWFARRLIKTGPTKERIVEKVVEKNVDNPQHLALISKLETENKEISSLRSKLSGFQTAAPKTVDNPDHLKKIKDLESQLYNYKNSSHNTPQAAVSTTTKTVDNPIHLKRIQELEAQVVTLKSAPEANQNASSAKISVKPKTVDNPIHLKRISELEAQLNDRSSGTRIDLAAAKSAGFNLSAEDDLTAIEGIGPKISDLIKADGVTSFGALSNTPVSSIQGVLDKAGPSYKIANPGTWPDQAHLAANNRWPALRALQDVLDGGVYPNSGSASKGTGSASSVNKLASSTSSTSSNSGSAVTSTAKATSGSTGTVDKAAAKAAGFRVRVKDGRDDFTVVEGIGPKINGLIHDANIHTYSALGRTNVDAIQTILDEAGPSYRLAKPGTWPAQADMAAENKWEELKAWQDELDGGK